MIVHKIARALPLLKRKRVAAYVRVSSGKDAMLQSLSAQVSYYSGYIQKHPDWEYAGVYADEAFTGTKDSRPNFQRLLTDCRSGIIDIVITKSISRFARNTVTMLETVRELRALNVDVFFEKEGIHSLSEDGELMLTILASYAQEESLSVSENCKWRIHKQFQEGHLANFRFMYGYKVSKSSIKADPECSKIVREVFEDYINGVGCNAIARRLRETNTPTFAGGTWTPKRVLNLIKNEKYSGNAVLQKRYVTDHLTKKSHLNHGKLPRYFAENTHQSIIHNDTFRQAQELIEQNRIRNNISKQPAKTYPFSGLIICGCCGKHYKRRVVRGIPSWQCSTFLQLGKEACHTKQIPEDILHALTAEVLSLPGFNEKALHADIKEILVPEFNHLIFVFHDGQSVERIWKDKSRRDSWNETAKEQARQRRREYLRRNSTCNSNLYE